MNYLQEINRFYDWLETNDVPKSAVALWHALMHINNKAEWKQTFEVAISTLEFKTKFRKSELCDARNILTQKGRINWKPRGGNLSATYEINPLCVHIADTKRETKKNSVHNTDASADAKGYSKRTQVRTQKGTINKLNKTETKLNNSAAAAAGDEKKGDVQSHWNLLVEKWFSFYENNFSVKPTFTGASAKTFKSVVDQLEKRSRSSGLEWTELQAVETLNVFLEKAMQHSEWLKRNFLLSNIANQFDAIVNPKNHERNSNPKAGGGAKITDSDLYAAFAKRYS